MSLMEVASPSRLFRLRQPNLRTDWKDKRKGEDGQISTQEGLWGVIVTMGVAASRDDTPWAMGCDPHGRAYRQRPWVAGKCARRLRQALPLAR